MALEGFHQYGRQCPLGLFALRVEVERWHVADDLEFSVAIPLQMLLSQRWYLSESAGASILSQANRANWRQSQLPIEWHTLG